jgi:hypothetical protein
MDSLTPAALDWALTHIWSASVLPTDESGAKDANIARTEKKLGWERDREPSSITHLIEDAGGAGHRFSMSVIACLREQSGRQERF